MSINKCLGLTLFDGAELEQLASEQKAHGAEQNCHPDDHTDDRGNHQHRRHAARELRGRFQIASFDQTTHLVDFAHRPARSDEEKARHGHNQRPFEVILDDCGSDSDGVLRLLSCLWR